jgi:hypothetical protein
MIEVLNEKFADGVEAFAEDFWTIPFHRMNLNMQKQVVVHCVKSDELYGIDEYKGQRERWIMMANRVQNFADLNRILQTSVQMYGCDVNENFVFEDTRTVSMVKHPLKYGTALGHRVTKEETVASFAVSGLIDKIVMWIEEGLCVNDIYKKLWDEMPEGSYGKDGYV